MEAAKKRVTRIDPITIRVAEQQRIVPKKRRVAAYARVSTDSDEQFTSFEAQVKYYTNQITENPDWAMVDVYTDVDTPYGRNTKLSSSYKLLYTQSFKHSFLRGAVKYQAECAYEVRRNRTEFSRGCYWNKDFFCAGIKANLQYAR